MQLVEPLVSVPFEVINHLVAEGASLHGPPHGHKAKTSRQSCRNLLSYIALIIISSTLTVECISQMHGTSTPCHQNDPASFRFRSTTAWAGQRYVQVQSSECLPSLPASKCKISEDVTQLDIHGYGRMWDNHSTQSYHQASSYSTIPAAAR